MSEIAVQHELIIISGLSGSGKSVALQSLEDIGFYCIDNMPVNLLPEFCSEFKGIQNSGAQNELRGAAVSIDSRSQHFLANIDDVLDNLDKSNVSFRILFLDAEQDRLVKRYSETRRKHPLTGPGVPLVEGIQRERALLQPLLDRAEKVIDTSTTTPHELRGLIRDFAGASSEAPLFLIESFGFKYGSPREADFVFDVRCLPNPHWIEPLRELTGLDQEVQEWLRQQTEVMAMTEEIFTFLNRWLPGFASENRSYITVGIGCTGGQHRSVFVCEQLRARFARHDVAVQVRHRELSKIPL